MPLVKWTDRTFNFDFPAALWPNLIERLRGLPARVEEKVRARPRESLTLRDGDDWSIQEHIGHLLDMDEPDGLHMGRIEDFMTGADTLRPADMTNRRTWDANHNEADLDELVARLRRARGAMLRRLESLSEDDYARAALHPRLRTPMRLVDMLSFWAEHDDHHLVRMTEIAARLDIRPD